MAVREFIVAAFRGRNALLIVCALEFCGCAVIGPRAISGGRGIYTEVINTTEDEQILRMIVRMRYDETVGMLTVSSVTANLRFSAQAGTNIGIGDSDNYAGNLVPLSVGVAYEENPTISYVPLSGELFMRRMLSPVDMNEWILLGSPAKHPGHVLALAARRINGMRNPLLTSEPRVGEFVRFAELYDQLRRAGVLDIVQPPKGDAESGYFWDIHDYRDAHDDSVREFLDLLGIGVEPDGSPILLPLRTAVGTSSSAVHLQMRSAHDVLHVMGAGVEIPSSHLEAGIVEPLARRLQDEERFMTIRTTEAHWWASRPRDATVAIRYRDRWYYIDATDARSKRAFLFLRTFIGMRLADAGAVQGAPILTLPAN